MHLQFVVCPTPGCGSYFGSSGMGDMSEVVAQKGANFEPRDSSRWHTRASCPNCRQRGLSVQRMLISVSVEIPEHPAPVGG